MRRLNCEEFNSVIAATHALQQLENAEDLIFVSQDNILREIHRLAQRQFEWQRKHLTFNRFYRCGLIYGGPLAQTTFETKHGVSIHEFTFTCFALVAHSMTTPLFLRNIDLKISGLEAPQVTRAIDIISASNTQARQTARRIRGNTGPVSYRKSVLRDFPCISFGEGRQRIYTPLPDLLISRSTTGLYYDTLSDDGAVRNEISGRFQSYCASILREMQPNLTVVDEFSYRYAGNQISSPDLFCWPRARRCHLRVQGHQDDIRSEVFRESISGCQTRL